MVGKTAGDGMYRNHHDFSTNIGDIIICTSNYVVATVVGRLQRQRTFYRTKYRSNII